MKAYFISYIKGAAFLLFAAWAFFSPRPLEAQLIVDETPTPQQLVQNVLVGNGVQVSNVTFTGDPIQVGEFDGTNASLPFDEGVVMSTGECPDAVGPNDEGAISTNLGNAAGDPDLLSIATMTNSTSEINDVAVIEFDFVPQGDSIAFDFVFGSEEYPGWVGTDYNDVFGFFISGPGINGPYSNNSENLALIPGTNDPISISDVNSSTNSTYFISNGDGYSSPYDTDPYYIQANGHTVSLTAEAQVNCGDTYHLKLKLGDGEDHGFDSWVFLKGGSLSSNFITVENSDVDHGQNDTTLWEGCGSASFDLVRQGDTTNADTVYVNTGGSATEGSDYTALPDTLFFPPGSDSADIFLEAFADGLVEGTEDVQIDLVYKDPSACANWDTVNIELFISDPDTIQLNTSPDTSIAACASSIDIWADASGGYGTYQWSWNQGVPNGDSAGSVSPNTTTTYVVNVSDTCGVGSPTDSITVSVPSYPPLDVHPSNDTDFVCPSQSVPVGLDSISGGSGNTVFWWDSLGTDSSYMVNPSGTSTYNVTAVDTCMNDTATASVTVTKAFNPLQLMAGRDTTVCAGTQANLHVRSYNGGTGDVDFEWEPGSYSGEELWYNTESIDGTRASETYTVTATDSCGVSVTDSMKVTLRSPIARFHYESQVLETGSPVHFISDSKGASDYFWNFGYQEYTSNSSDTVLSYPKPGTYEVSLGVTNNIGCVDTTQQMLEIKPPFNFYVPNAFTPDGDGLNDVFRAEGAGMKSYHMRIFDRWGKMVFETKEPGEGWDGTINGDAAPEGIYVYKIKVEGKNGDIKQVTGHVTLIR